MKQSPKFGLHLPIAGGLEKALLRSRELGGDAVQIFSRNPRGWTARPLDGAEVRRFRATRRESKISPVVIHANYLINLAAADLVVREKSVASFREEIERGVALGADYVVLHPGSARGACEREAIHTCAESIKRACDGLKLGRLRVLLENTAGQGECIGHRFEHLREIIEMCPAVKLGVCFDTAHAFAAGYDLRDREGFAATIAALENNVGLKNVRVVHFNDSKSDYNSRVDRHWHIGAGRIGAEALSRVARHPKLRHAAFLLETPQDEPGDDRRNLDQLRSFLGGAPPPPRYCRDDTARFVVGGESHLVYAKFRRAAEVLPAHLVRLLEHCQTFQTLDDHARDFLRGLMPGAEGDNQAQLEFLRNELKGLAGRGLLVSEEELRKWCRQFSPTNAAETEETSIETVGVVTRDRPESLRRCVASHIENSQRHDRAPRFVVTDDSARAATRRRNKEMLGALRDEHGVRLAYAGREEKRRFAAKLASVAADVPPEVINFALFDTEECGHSTGANRNALLLDTVGEVALSADDDTVCRVAAAPGADPGLALDARREATRYWFFPDRESAQRFAPAVEKDVLKIHEQLLGRSLRECVAAFDSPRAGSTGGLHFEQVNAKPLRDLEVNRGRVLATFTGIVGDSGLGAPIGYLQFNSDSRERLVSSEEAYRCALTSREVTRAVDRPRINSNAWCMTTAYGFDNRGLLPPFFPVGRGQDDVWALTVQLCREDGYFGHLPWTTAHEPSPARRYAPGSVGRAARLCVFEIALAGLTTFRVGPGAIGDAERMRSLGRHLVALGAMRHDDFDEFVRLRILQQNAGFITHLENLLRAYKGAPKFWADDVSRQIAALGQALARDDYFVAEDLRANRSDDEARRLAQRLIHRFGQLLYWWPRMVAAAETLRVAGERISVAL